MYLITATFHRRMALFLLMLCPGMLLIGRDQPRAAFSKADIVERSITWLAGEDKRDQLHVYKLSCPKCVYELKEALASDPMNLGLISLSTFKKEDRPLAQALLAATLSQESETRQAEVFNELLVLFSEDAGQFLTQPDAWRTLCLSYWDENAVASEDPKPWADALNWMDQQNRLNILLDLVAFPGSLQLQETNPIPPIPKSSYRDQYLFVALSLPWLKYPPVHPVKEQPPSGNHPENLPTILVHPLQPLPVANWQQHAQTAEAGAFWNFIGEPDVILHPRLLEFLTIFLDLPTDQARRVAFVQALETMAGNSGGRPTSLLATYPRVKDALPAANPAHREERLEEARRMIEDFRIYDAIRQGNER